MFKTDELIKQSRENLKKIEDAANKTDLVFETIRNKTEEELAKVTQRADDEAKKISSESLQTIEDVKKEIDTMREGFSNMVKERSDTFEDMYRHMMEKVQQTSTMNSNIIGELAELFKNYVSQNQKS